ncbi:hypothetical protein [Gordonia sp. DT101]|uniref:hypothetical protein n=1 Tax=Gordonia sp. DT101 TaxID=3416545 RepID=UPI003CF01495
MTKDSTPPPSDATFEDYGLAHTLDARPDQPTLREAAKHLILPDGIESTLWPKIEYRLSTLGVTLDNWQASASSAALGLDADGKFACTIGGVTASIPRQVGKSFWVSHLLIALCIEIPGLKATWTSHHGRTTTNTFRAVAAAVSQPLIKSHLRQDRSNGIRSTNGEQEIHFANGSRIMFGAREQGFGRGLDAIDIVVMDEAQQLGIKHSKTSCPP